MNEIFAEHRSLVESGRFEEAMRFSGEQLAAAEATLNAAADDNRIHCALNLLNVGSLHLADLHYAGMLNDEAATSLMIAATLIIARVNPEKIAAAYADWLQKSAMRFGDALQQADDERLLPYFAMVLKLAVVTTDDYAARFSLEEETLRANAAMRNYLDMSGMADTKFDGKEIVPQMAIDILMNTLNTMVASGWFVAPEV